MRALLPVSLIATLLLSACATGPVNSGLQVETVSAGQALAGANCVVSHGGQSFTVLTPATVPVNSSGGDLRVWCEKAGYRTSELVLQAGVSNGWWGPSVGLGLSSGGYGRTGLGLGLSFPFFSPVRSTPGRVTVEMSPQ